MHLKSLHSKPILEPLLNVMCLLGGSVEKLGIIGKKDNLPVSNIQKESWHNYQRVVKTEKSECLSDLILKKRNSRRPLKIEKDCHH